MNPLPALLLVTALSAVPLAGAQAAEDVLIVYDASGSMWGQIDGVNKIVTAREVMADLVQGWPEGTNLGLVAYGHRSAGDCKDIETLITPQPVDRQQFIATVNAINPKGKTPIADSLEHAADVLQYRDNNATVVLISDGLESCHGDPCAVAAALEEKGVDFTAHVVGFDLDEQGNQALACIADNTGGVFVPAANAGELKQALQQVQARVEQKQAATEPEPQPEPEPETPDADITIDAPQQVTAGAVFEISWSNTVATDDYYSIVPAGAKEGAGSNRGLVRDKLQGTLKAPAEPGMYEVRYVLRQSGRTLASAPVEVIAAEVGISAPQQVTTGAVFEVSWSNTVATDDYYSIVPAGAKEGAGSNRGLVRDKQQGTLKAPAEPGMYEVRYVLRQGGRTLASTPVEVIAAEIGISAPQQVTTGAVFEVSWSNTVATDDYYSIVPAGAKEGAGSNRGLVRDKQQGTLKAPAEPGMYEVRYVLRQGGRTLASTPVEVIAAEIGISAPEMVRAGTPVDITWTTAIAQDDYYAIVPAGAKEGAGNNRGLVRDKLQGTLKAPTEPGMYEVRYVLRQGGRTLASAPMEVVPEDAALDSGAGLDAPAEAEPGQTITVRWSGGSASPDQRIALAQADAADFTWISAHKAGEKKSLELTLPDAPGRYEIRYLDVSNTQVLGRSIVEVRQP